MSGTVEQRINELVSNFINAITLLAKEVAMTTLTSALGGEIDPAMLAATRPPGAKRSPDELAKIGDDLLAFIAQHPGLRIEEINAQLGTKTREVFRPLKKLIASKRVRTEGDRRSTRYYAGPAWPVKPAAKPAAKRSARAVRPALDQKAKPVKPGEALTLDQVKAAIAKGGSMRAAGRLLGVANSTFRDACERLGLLS